ncbi:MAG: c-type cytochrome [Acidobacteriota bacterium]
MTLAFPLRILALTLLSAGVTVSAQQPAAATLAADVCASCHGPDGLSVSPAFPRLAGQNAAYLEAQLKAFRDRTRADPMAQAFMWGMTSQLSDPTIAGLAAYYAAQKPAKAASGDAKQVALGEPIFLQGVPAAGVAACQTCHGPQGEGNAVIPRLAGQHAEYLLKQLVLFKSDLRAGASAPVMHGISSGMTFDQMSAVSAYAASR